jgi:hypothetical protein
MPDISAAPTRAYAGYTVQLRDFTGKPATANIEAGAEATPAQLIAVRTGIGNMSNARVMETATKTGVKQINPANPLNTTYDEAYATVDVKAVFVFQNDDGDVQYVRVPAPDASIFQTDGETVLEPVVGSPTLTPVTAMVTALNASTPAGTWIYVRAYKEGSAARGRVPLPIGEPGAGTPGDAPGV